MKSFNRSAGGYGGWAPPPGRYRKPKPKLLKIELVHEGIDGPHHIIETNVILNARRKKARLLPADAGLEGTNRHKTNRTPMRKTGYEFLPSLFASSGLRTKKAGLAMSARPARSSVA